MADSRQETTQDAQRIPAAVSRLAEGERVTSVWTNQLGGITFEVGDRPRHRYVKWNPASSPIRLEDEAQRLEWAAGFTLVPQVLEHGRDEMGEWLVTAALHGESAVTKRWRTEPELAVVALGEGLRHLHDTLPVLSCPFSWDAKSRADGARKRIDPATWHEEHQNMSTEEAISIGAQAPPVDQLVVCHGDACAPNTILTDDGDWLGHVDLGDLGIADRWADLAVATWSTTWNYGPGWESTLLDAYGIAPDRERTRYYRLLWDLD